MKLNDSIRFVKGVGPKREEKFNELGIFNIFDLLYYFPRAYDDRSNFKKISDCVSGERVSIRIKFLSLIQDRRIRKGLHLISFAACDDSGRCEISFFNMPYLKKQIDYNKEYVVTGKVGIFKGKVQISSPSIEEYSIRSNENLIHPIYPLKRNINNTEILNTISEALSLNIADDLIPLKYREKYNLLNRNDALKFLHFPKDRKSYVIARNTLVYEELLLFQLKMQSLKLQNEIIRSNPFVIDNRIYEFINSLPFILTDGQQKVLREIFDDVKSEKRMNRLLQGDVGSGKTIISVIVSYLAYLNGYQSAIMAPTEILARQHLENFRQLLEPFGVKIELLIGSTTPKNKSRILSLVENGEVDILIGTHALIEDNVKFRNLGFNVVDEQHRFGVRQRESLNTKNKLAHTLVMTATPIPRTLSLILYGDLSISTIDSLPPNRKSIDTMAINESMLNNALIFIKDEIKKGRQAYIVCPLIEESEHFDLDSATEVYNELSSGIFRDLRIGLLHGKMAPIEKSQIMDDFKNHKLDIIISTTVIEVGVNVPNATVMLVYNVERFGLSQLHQLRGRVGRGEHKSYCIFYNTLNSKIAWKRMEVMTNSNDGFYIANMDLELRGSGDVLGTRQSGNAQLRLADLVKDIKILEQAQIDASEILKEDRYLKNYNSLRENIEMNYKIDTSILN